MTQCCEMEDADVDVGCVCAGDCKCSCAECECWGTDTSCDWDDGVIGEDEP